MTIVMLVGVVVVFYFFILRPQKKQEKQAAEMMNSLAVGDEITTIGGIVGRIVRIKEETCVIETSKDGTEIPHSQVCHQVCGCKSRGCAVKEYRYKKHRFGIGCRNS